MSHIGRFAGVIILFGFIAGCSRAASEAPSSVVRELGDVFINASLQPAGQGSGISGAVRVVDLPATSDLHVQLEANGLPPGPHAWHIHSGTCANPGSVLVPFTSIGQMEGLDAPVVAGADGRAAEDAHVPGNLLTREQLTAGSYSLHIHAQAGTNPGSSIACATLR